MLNKIKLVLLAVLVLLSQIIAPLTIIAQSSTGKQNEDHGKNLYQFSEPYMINDEIEITKDIYLYGENLEDTNLTTLQYKEDFIEVPNDLLSEVELPEEEFRTYEEYDPDHAYEMHTFNAGDKLYLSGEEAIVVNNNSEYPISMNEELGVKEVYLGNIAFYLNGEDSILVEDKDKLLNNQGSSDEESVEVDDSVEKEIETPEKVEQDEQESAKKEDSKLPDVEKEKTNKPSVISTSFQRYFKVEVDKLPVYDNRSGKLVKVGEMKKGQVYPRVSGYGANWHRIQFNDFYGYVETKYTSASTGREIGNENKQYKNESKIITAKSDVVIYDNTTKGKLTPFGIIGKGHKYHIVSDYGNWWRVIFSDRVGYINKRDVTLNISGNEDYFKVDQANLEVYDNRSGSLVKVGELSKGQVYPRVSSYGANWHRIQFNDIYGYVETKHTSAASGTEIKNENHQYKNESQTFTALRNVIIYDNLTISGKLTPFGTIEKGQTYHIVSDYGNWWRVIYSDRVGYVSKRDVILQLPANENYFKVERDNLEVYDNRSGSLVKVGELSKGQVYPRVSSYGANWHRIQFNNFYGYVETKHTSAASGLEIKNENTQFKHGVRTLITKSDLTIYDNTTVPGELTPFGTIQKGTSYQIVSDYGNWWRVIYADRIGYVSKNSVQVSFLSGDKYFEVLTEKLPVYDNRTGSLIKVGELVKGQTYQITSDYGNWWRVQFGDLFGYVQKQHTVYGVQNNIKNLNKSFTASDYRIKVTNSTQVMDNSSGALVPFGKLEQGVFYPVVSDYGRWVRIIYLDRVGYVNKNDIVSEAFGDYFEVKGNGTFVKQNIEGKLVNAAFLNAGQVYKRIADYGRWHEVQFGNETAYVWKEDTMSPFENVHLPDSPTIFKEVLMAISNAKLYDEKFKEIGYITRGTHVDIETVHSKDYYKGLLGNKEVFIKEKELTAVDNKDLALEITKQYEEEDRSTAIDRITMLSPPPSKNFIKVADNLLYHDIYSLGNYGEFKFAGGIDWAYNPTESQTVSYFRYINTHYFLYDLLEAYKETSSELYIEKAYKIIIDWINKNPLGNPIHDMSWHDEATSQRIITWVNFYDHAKKVLSAEQLAPVIDSMLLHADLLLDEEYHAELTNHGMFQDQGIIVFVDYFDKLSFSEEYSNIAKNRLLDYFQYIISAEGVHLEHSPAYHRTIATSIYGYMNYFEDKGDLNFSKVMRDYYNKMVKYSTHVLKPDGIMPNIGDTFGNTYPAGELWEQDEYYQFARTKGEKGITPLERNIVFPQAGYAIFREDWNKKEQSTYVNFTAAYHTGYHKHSDDLSVWIYANGHDLIREAGPNGYDMQEPYVKYGFSSFAHNSLVVNKQSMQRVDGKFELTYLTDYEVDEKHGMAAGVNKRYDDVVHERKVEYSNSEDHLTVTDCVSSSRNNNYQFLWNLAVDVEPELINGNQILIKKNGIPQIDMKIFSDSDFTISFVKGQTKPYLLGWYLPNLREYEPTYTIVIETENQNAKFTTEFDILDVE